MAATIYVSKQAVTLQNRAHAYEMTASFLLHLDTFNLNVVSIIRRADNFIEITINNPIPAAQLSHLELDGPF